MSLECSHYLFCWLVQLSFRKENCISFMLEIKIQPCTWFLKCHFVNWHFFNIFWFVADNCQCQQISFLWKVYFPIGDASTNAFALKNNLSWSHKLAHLFNIGKFWDLACAALIENYIFTVTTLLRTIPINSFCWLHVLKNLIKLQFCLFEVILFTKLVLKESALYMEISLLVSGQPGLA